MLNSSKLEFAIPNRDGLHKSVYIADIALLITTPYRAVRDCAAPRLTGIIASR